MLGLPDSVTVCLFDLDGVLTDTASVHRRAWKQTFDPILADHGQDEFTDDDYADEVDGKPRADGVRDFLHSRGIDLPEGAPDDGPEQDTVYGVGNRKNALLQKAIKQDGVTVFDDARRYLEAAREAGLRRVVVSSSANTADVLHVTGLAHFIEAPGRRQHDHRAASQGQAGAGLVPGRRPGGRRRSRRRPRCSRTPSPACRPAATAGSAASSASTDWTTSTADNCTSHGASVVVTSLDELR